MAFLWIIVIVSVLAGIISAATAPKMGRSPGEAFLLGLFLWPIGLIMTIMQAMRPAATASDLLRIRDGLIRDRRADIAYAADSRTAPETLEHLARMYDQDQEILFEIAKNPNAPRSVLEMFALFKSERVGQAARVQLKARSR